MSLAVEWAHDALSDIARLDRRTRERIRQAIYRLAETEYSDVVRLKGKRGELRLRVDDWRVRLMIDQT